MVKYVNNYMSNYLAFICVHPKGLCGPCHAYFLFHSVSNQCNPLSIDRNSSVFPNIIIVGLCVKVQFDVHGDQWALNE